MLHFVVLVFSCWIIPRLNAQEANITIPPRNVNISIGGVAEFNCTGVATGFVWFKNGQPIDNGEGAKIASPVTVNKQENIRMSTLKITVTSTDNAANITCGAYYITPQSLHTNKNSTALMLVQGLLKPVHNLNVVPMNSTTVLISWSPPFTLEGVPILGYNVTITNTTSGENETTSVEGDTTILYYTIGHPHPVDNFIVTVICINKAGPGENASMTFSMSLNQTASLLVTSTLSTLAKSDTTSSISSTITPAPGHSMSPAPLKSDNKPGIIIGAIIIMLVVAVPVIICISIMLVHRRRQQKKKPSRQVVGIKIKFNKKNQSPEEDAVPLLRSDSYPPYKPISAPSEERSLPTHLKMEISKEMQDILQENANQSM